YRDQLLEDERATLDAYLKEMAKVRRNPVAPAAGPAAAPVPASGGTLETAPAATPATSVTPVAVPGGNGGPALGEPAAALPAGTDTKQRGRWLLHEAREQLLLGNYDAAQRKTDEAEALDVKWGLFDDTPAKVQAEIKKARPKAAATAASSGAGQAH